MRTRSLSACSGVRDAKKQSAFLQKWHPDKHIGDEKATHIFAEISEAYRGAWPAVMSMPRDARRLAGKAPRRHWFPLRTAKRRGGAGAGRCYAAS